MILLMTIEASGSKTRARRFDGARTRLADLARALLFKRRNVVEPPRSVIVINVNPQTLSLLASAASGVIKAVPKGQLARFGLARAPLAAPLALSPLPLAAAAAGGVLVVALIVPSSRRWLFAKATTLTTAVRSKILERGTLAETSVESPPATDVANGHVSVA
jgi:hypothetical protein